MNRFLSKSPAKKILKTKVSEKPKLEIHFSKRVFSEELYVHLFSRFRSFKINEDSPASFVCSVLIFIFDSTTRILVVMLLSTNHGQNCSTPQISIFLVLSHSHVLLSDKPLADQSHSVNQNQITDFFVGNN